LSNGKNIHIGQWHYYLYEAVTLLSVQGSDNIVCIGQWRYCLYSQWHYCLYGQWDYCLCRAVTLLSVQGSGTTALNSIISWIIIRLFKYTRYETI
jgi:hypothetical protein